MTPPSITPAPAPDVERATIADAPFDRSLRGERHASLPFPVLLVEDKDSLRAMLRLALEGQGHAVLEARDEDEARAQLREARPAGVLTDLKLPAGDGFGVLRAAKEIDPELQ